MKIKVIAATQHDLLTYWAINGDVWCISNIMCRKLCCKYRIMKSVAFSCNFLEFVVWQKLGKRSPNTVRAIQQGN